MRQRLFDEQIRLYPAATETVGAIYWRGRLYETQDHKPAQGRGQLSRDHPCVPALLLRADGAAAAGGAGQHAACARAAAGSTAARCRCRMLVESFPADSPHLAKARLLANAGLNEYIAQEIAADPDSGVVERAGRGADLCVVWRDVSRHARAEAGAAVRGLGLRSSPFRWSTGGFCFPEPWWETIKAESAKNNLDPYLVASLIRQESEFNPSVVSYANAYGLMQLLPSVGKAMAREEGMSHFQTFQLLDPETNIRLGTRYLRKMLDKFGGVQEYALAAYNAGDSRVADWQAAGPYQGMDEFVESIPFTQTREYVEAILRNVETYRAIDAAARAQGRSADGAGR